MFYLCCSGLSLLIVLCVSIFKQFSTPHCGNLISLVKEKQVYSSFPQLKYLTLIPVPSHISVLRHFVPSSSPKVVQEMQFFLKPSGMCHMATHHDSDGNQQFLQEQQYTSVPFCIHPLITECFCSTTAFQS